jgi:hypothetical protein
MSQLLDSQLSVKAAQIIAEVVPEANTKERVGGLNQDIIDSKINKSQIDTANTLGTATDKVPSQSAVKAYVDTATTGLLDDRGNYNASGNVFPSTGGSGTAGAIKKGDLWYISTAGTLGGNAVAVGASVRALVDTPGQTAGNWSVLSNGVGYTPENSANKSTNITTDTGSDVKYPSVKAVETFVAANTGLPWKAYTVGLAQSGTSNPAVQSVVMNTLTNTGVPNTDPAYVNLVLRRDSTGLFRVSITSATAIDVNKVKLFWADGKLRNDTFGTGVAGALFLYDFYFKNFDFSGALADGFSFATLEVRLYA